MKTSSAVIYWLPRIICILAILFIGMFSLDAFQPGLPLWKQLTGFLMHNIPAFILLAALILAWKREFIGGILFIVLGIVMSILIFNINYDRNQFSFVVSLRNAAMIAVPFILAGILFVLSHNRRKKTI